MAPFLCFDAVNGVDAVQIVLHRVAYGIFSGFQRQTFMPHILQCNDFFADFLLGQLFSCDMFVFQMIRAVCTAVYAVVGQIERCEHDDPVPVEILFDLLCPVCRFPDFFLPSGRQEERTLLCEKVLFSDVLFQD